jgi:hypothetical protein
MRSAMHLEAGKIEAIAEMEIVGMGKIMKKIFHKKRKLIRTLGIMKLKEKNHHHHHQHWQK